MSKIIFDYPHNGVTVRHIHTLHFITLYRGYIYEVSTNDLAKDEAETEILGNSFAKWAGEEVLRVGLITLYHYWERSIDSLFKEQVARSNISYTGRKTGSMNEWVKAVLTDSFDANVDDNIWVGLEEIRRIVNTLKHADLDTYKNLANDFGYYFGRTKSAPQSAEDFENCFEIGLQNFDRLTTFVISFWETLPHNVNYTKR